MVDPLVNEKVAVGPCRVLSKARFRLMEIGLTSLLCLLCRFVAGNSAEPRNDQGPC